MASTHERNRRSPGEAPRARHVRAVAILGIAIGVLTTLLGCLSFAFAITGEGEVLIVGWLSLV